jgi:hypothetical protein
MQITRRDFLTILITAPVVGTTVGCSGDEDRLTVSSLDVTVPAWLFDEQGKNGTRAQLLAIEKSAGAKEIAFVFTGDRQLALNTDTSVRSLLQGNADRPIRKSMLLKRIVSYSLDATLSSIGGKRRPDKSTALREEFDALQAEEVIDVITVGALYDLLSQLDGLPTISSVSWAGSEQRFIVL